MSSKLFFSCLIAATLVMSFDCNAEQSIQPPFEKLKNSHFLFHENQGEKVEIIYFFNLNCSSCVRFEKFIHAWSDRHDKTISFKAIPSPVKPAWQLANNTYFAVKLLNPHLKFWDIMDKQVSAKKDIYNFDSANSFVQQFSKQPSDLVASAVFSKAAFKYSEESNELYKQFDIKGTPTLILIAKNHNTYKISPEFTDTYPKMLTVADALISYNNQYRTSK